MGRFIVAEAKKRHLHLIIALLDFWDYTGGAQQMRAWYGSHNNEHFFFADSRTKRDYQNGITHVWRLVSLQENGKLPVDDYEQF